MQGDIVAAYSADGTKLLSYTYDTFGNKTTKYLATDTGHGASYGNTAGMNASWKQLFKKGIKDKSARSYFYKTAHKAGGECVLSSLFKSSKYNAFGSAIVAGKNWIKGRLSW